MDREVDKGDEVRVRHRVQTHFIVELNSSLTSFQKERIKNTPFKFVAELVNKVVISCPILLELIRRWDVVHKGFRIRENVVPFTVDDVCFCLGLSNGGETINLENEHGGIVNNLFQDEDITPLSIIEKLRDKKFRTKKNIDNYCRLYLLLTFGVFYFPKNTEVINNVPFSKLDNMDQLSMYNWGNAVYSLIVGSLDRAADKYNCKTYKHAIHISGCAAVLQLWVMEHVSLYRIGGRSIYPPILDWIMIRDKWRRIKSTFEQSEILWERNEEMKETLPSGETMNNCNNDDDDFARVVQEQRLLRRLVDDHAERLLQLEKTIKRLQQDDMNEKPPFNDGVAGHSTAEKGRELVIHGGIVDGGIHGCSSNDNIDFSILYKTCTSVLCDDGHEVLVEVSNYMLTKADFQCLKPRGKIDNMVMLFATGMVVHNEMQISGMISRCCLNPFFATMVMERMKIPKKKRQPLTITDYHNFFVPQSSALNVLLTSQFLFVPTVGDDHWWCYAINCQSREMFILDSLGHKRRPRKKFDKAMVAALQQVFNMVDIDSKGMEQELKVIEEDLPDQPNTYDCGLLVIKYMELWDHTPKFDGKKMPDYTTDELQGLRQQMVCEWVLHKDNVRRSTVLKKCGTI